MTATLDFIGNPRWRGENTISVPMVAGRIYVMESWNKIAMNELAIFGTEVFQDNSVKNQRFYTREFVPAAQSSQVVEGHGYNMCASDHYGIVAQLQFEK